MVANALPIQSKQRNKASFDRDKTFEIVKKAAASPAGHKSRLNTYFR